MNGWSETELLGRCRRGEAEAWTELFDRHYAACGRFVAQLSPGFSAEDIEEVTQEAFLAVVRNLGAFHGQCMFQTWLFRIAGNKARDWAERRRARKRGGGATPVPLHAPHPETGRELDPPSPAPGPDECLAREERFEELHAALREVGEPCRETIELRYFGDLSYEEIALALEMNPKTVSSRLSKCLDKLQEILDGKSRREISAPIFRLTNDGH